ncbi:protein of unknown function (DUF4780) [Popillia japonica]|uniref:DUF4780 domain-containing protein n=1 Tax=Popillia japonica TaxID=7064 RepID=A0AAW1LXQ0_POPJA
MPSERSFQLPSQGLAPEEATKKEEEHKTPGEQRTSPAVPKRKKKETAPTPGQAKKRKEGGRKHTTSTSTADNYAMAVKRKRIAILPKAFPKTILSADEQTALEEAIVQEMFGGWKHKIQFAGNQFRPGLILVECDSPHSAEWFRLKVPVLKTWKGVLLTTCKGEDIPKSHTATLFSPEVRGRPPKSFWD